MARFMYIGDPNDDFSGPHVTTQFGYTFVKGEPVDVPDKSDQDKFNVEKLRGHSHFIDTSDKGQVEGFQSRSKELIQRAKDNQKREEEQRKRDEADQKAMEANREKEEKKRGPGVVTAANAPAPPGQVTRDPMPDAFGGRTVEQRTQAEDHTKAGKTKGGSAVVL